MMNKNKTIKLILSIFLLVAVSATTFAFWMATPNVPEDNLGDGSIDIGTDGTFETQIELSDIVELLEEGQYLVPKTIYDNLTPPSGRTWVYEIVFNIDVRWIYDEVLNDILSGQTFEGALVVSATSPHPLINIDIAHDIVIIANDVNPVEVSIAITIDSPVNQDEYLEIGGTTFNFPLTASVLLGQSVLTFDSQGGSLPKGARQRIITNDTLYNDLPTPVLTGFRFLHWISESESVVVSNGDSIPTPITSHTLLAVWDELAPLDPSNPDDIEFVIPANIFGQDNIINEALFEGLVLFANMSSEQIVREVRNFLDLQAVSNPRLRSSNFHIEAQVIESRLILTMERKQMTVDFIGSAVLQGELLHDFSVELFKDMSTTQIEDTINEAIDNLYLVDFTSYFVDVNIQGEPHVYEMTIDINYKVATITIEPNTDGIFNPIITGAIQEDGIYTLRARYGLRLSQVLDVVTLSSDSHLNPSLIYDLETIIAEDQIVSINWGEIRVLMIEAWLWSEAQTILNIFPEDEQIVFPVHFGASVSEFIDAFLEYILNNYYFRSGENFVSTDFEFDFYAQTLHDQGDDRQSTLTRMEDEDVIKYNLSGYLFLNYRSFEVEVRFPDFEQEYQRFQMPFNTNLNIFLSTISIHHRPGYMLTEWVMYLSVDGQKVGDGISVDIHTVMPRNDVILEAQYERLPAISVTINLGAVGVLVSGVVQEYQSITSEVEQYISLLDFLRDLNIQRIGHNLNGFFINGNPVNFDTIISLYPGIENESFEITIEWEAVTRYIYVYLDLPTEAPQLEGELSFQVTFGTAISAPLNTITIALSSLDLVGFVFTGWQLVDFNGNSFDEEYMPNFAIIATALWTRNTNTLTIWGNYGTVKNADYHTIEVPYGKYILEYINYSYLKNYFSNADNQVLGLSRTSSGSELISYYTTMPDANLELYVVWYIANEESRFHDVYIELNGGLLLGYGSHYPRISLGQMTADVLLNYLLRILKPIRNGYTFTYWTYNYEVVDVYTEFGGPMVIISANWNSLTRITIHAEDAIFDQAESILIENVPLFTNEQQAIDFLNGIKDAYNAVNNTYLSAFFGINFNSVDGINLLGFSTTPNGQNILEVGSALELLNYHIVVYAIVRHYTVGLFYTYNADGNAILSAIGSANLLNQHKITNNTLVIPHHFRGLKVVEIGLDAFRGSAANSTIHIVELPRYLKHIRDGAFRQSHNLHTINLSNLEYLETIGFESFLQMAQNNPIDSLNITNLPNLTLIANRAFHSARITNLVLDNLASLETIQQEAFRGTNQRHLELRNLPSLTSIEQNTWAGNGSLFTIRLENLNPNLRILGGRNTFGGNVSGRTVWLDGYWNQQAAPLWWVRSGDNPFGNLNNNNHVQFRLESTGQLVLWP